MYLSPQDDTVDVFVNLISGARTCIHLADYSYNIAPITNLLIAKHQAGIEVKVVLDYSQSKERSEVPHVDALKRAGVPMKIVESSKGRIMHDKFMTIDNHIAQFGSWNYTVAAGLENNFYFVWDDDKTPSDVHMALHFDRIFTDMWNGKTTRIKYAQ